MDSRSRVLWALARNDGAKLIYIKQHATAVSHYELPL